MLLLLLMSAFFGCNAGSVTTTDAQTTTAIAVTTTTTGTTASDVLTTSVTPVTTTTTGNTASDVLTTSVTPVTTITDAPTSNVDSTSEFVEKFNLVLVKVEHLIIEMTGINPEDLRDYPRDSLKQLSEFDPGSVYYPEDFLEMYNPQTMTITAVQSLDFIFEIWFLLEKLEQVIDFDDLILGEEQIIEPEGFGTMTATFTITFDGQLLMCFVRGIENIYLKAGFDESGLFHSAWLNYAVEEGSQAGFTYNYNEFLEGVHYIIINSLEGDWIAYAYYDFLHGRQKGYEMRNGTENITFYLLENNTVFHFQFVDGLLDGRILNFLSEHSIVIYYEEGYGDYVPSGFVRLRWQMLEATGWDYVVAKNMERGHLHPITEGDGIYVDDQNLFVFGQDQLNVDLSLSANVTLSKLYSKALLTDEILNLSAYGLTLSIPELTLDLVDQTFALGLQMIDEGIVFNNVDFRSETIREDVLALLDPDIFHTVFTGSTGE